MQTGKGILIPSILKVGNGTLKKIGQYLKAENLEQVVIFFGNGLIDLFGMDVMDSLKQEGITVLEYSELDKSIAPPIQPTSASIHSCG